jgi:hypothetical protein
MGGGLVSNGIPHGELPGDGPVTLADVELPPGRRLFSDFNPGHQEPVLWATDGNYEDAAAA